MALKKKHYYLYEDKIHDDNDELFYSIYEKVTEDIKCVEKATSKAEDIFSEDVEILLLDRLELLEYIKELKGKGE